MQIVEQPTDAAEALRIIDEALASSASVNLMPASDVRNVLLDLRIIFSQIEKAGRILRSTGDTV